MTPKALVDRAKGHVRSNRPTKRRAADYDEIWCVFDIDEHPNVPQAVEEARQVGVEVAVSNPCFELWLVLHIRDRETARESTSTSATPATAPRPERIQARMCGDSLIVFGAPGEQKRPAPASHRRQSRRCAPGRAIDPEVSRGRPGR